MSRSENSLPLIKGNASRFGNKNNTGSRNNPTFSTLRIMGGSQQIKVALSQTQIPLAALNNQRRSRSPVPLGRQARNRYRDLPAGVHRQHPHPDKMTSPRPLLDPP